MGPNLPDLTDCAAATVVQFSSGAWRNVADELAVEEPLEIRVRGRAISVTMRTPGHDDELAIGFLLSEGIIRAPADIHAIAPCLRNEFGNVINVQLAPDVAVDFARLTRHVFASSSCGVCGKASVESIQGHFPSIDEKPRLTIAPEILLGLGAAMAAEQRAFDRTGGLHAAGIFDSTGTLRVLREDVGRHNAVDKVIGHACRAGWLPLNNHILLVSGRLSFEILQKALSAGIPMIAAISAPSHLAVEFARSNGQTLIGFLRNSRFNVYTHPDRVTNGEAR